ncbi:TPA: AAA family ATPase, partial [Yersinia enterocolitica]|nr:AAA family ATPase [Yersinia enterocolitica]
MYIDNIYLKGYRNYSDAYIRLDKTTLIIGANDVGKTNLLYSLRLLLDKSLSELDLEPKSNDFHIDKNGAPAEEIEITLNFKDVTEDAVISKLSGYVSESNEVFIR